VLNDGAAKVDGADYEKLKAAIDKLLAAKK
jgi:hypothetical protein